MRLSKKVKKAMEKAEKEARKQALKPKRKRTKRVDGEATKQISIGRWIDDEWGSQGCVFFDGYYYWGVGLFKPTSNPHIKEVVDVRWTPEEWEKRKKGESNESSGGSLERGRSPETTEHNEKATRPSGKRGKSSRSKTRKNKSVSCRKSSKLVKK